MKILVTGGTGFIGSHLVKNLLNIGKEVKVLTRKERKISAPVEVVIGDITDFNSLKRAVKDVDIVFHLAAVTSGSKISERAYWEVNVKGTENIIKASVNQVEKFILCSTAKVLGPSVKPLNENSLPNPMTIYEKTKLESEKIAVKYFGEKSSKLVIVRPSFTYGPGSHPMLNLLKFIKKSKFIIAGKNLIQPVYVDDLVSFFLLCLKKKISGCYIVAGNAPLTMENFIKTIEKFLNEKSKFHLSPFFIPAAKLLLPLFSKYFELNISSEMLNSFRYSYVYDTSKAKKVGWTPKINVNEGIKRTVEWFKNLKFRKSV
jgi:dihydroflavonol-4-reductase